MTALLRALSRGAIDLQKTFPVQWNMRRLYELPTGDPEQPFYIRWRPGGGIFGEEWDRFDREGVLRIERYNPCSVAAYALYCYEQLHGGISTAREPLIRQADFLLRTQREDGAYPYDFAFPQYGLKPGWISCITQAKAAAALRRVFIVTSDERYKAAATRALLPLTKDVCSGGTSLLRGDVTFFEEISANPTHILNGHLYAAFAAWEACRWGTAPPQLREILEASVETLVRLLPQYDGGGWSYYQLAARGDGERHYAPINYHQTHVAQLAVFHVMTGRHEFLEMSEKWREGLKRWDVRARVWADSASWVWQTARRRAAREAAAPWHSTLLPSA